MDKPGLNVPKVKQLEFLGKGDQLRPRKWACQKQMRGMIGAGRR